MQNFIKLGDLHDFYDAMKSKHVAPLYGGYLKIWIKDTHFQFE